MQAHCLERNESVVEFCVSPIVLLTQVTLRMHMCTPACMILNQRSCTILKLESDCALGKPLVLSPEALSSMVLMTGNE